MKILILATFDVFVYNFKKELIKQLVNDGHEVVLNVPKGGIRYDDLLNLGITIEDLTIDRRGLNPLKDLKLLQYYNSLVKRIKPDKIITYTIKPNIYGGIIARKYKIPYYTNISGLGTGFTKTFLKLFVVMLYKISLKKSCYVFLENYANADVFKKYKIVPLSKLIVVNGSGVNLEEFTYSELKTKDKCVFLFMGRIMEEKGVNEFIEAAALIKQEYPHTEFNLIGLMEENFKDKIAILSDKNIIKYHGFIADVKPYIINADCVVLPSYHEGMSNTLLESAAMGRPIITSNINGCMEAVQDNISGYLVKVKDIQDLYDKLKTFILLPYETKKQFSLASRKLMEERFNRQSVNDIFIQAFYK